MTSRLLRLASWLTIRHPAFVAVGAAFLTVVLCVNVRNLKMGTNLTDLFGSDTPQWRVVKEFAETVGYGNQLFLIVESDAANENAAMGMESAADRLISAMIASGHFRTARCGLTREELLGMVRLFAWNFPYLIKPEQQAALRVRLSDSGIQATVRRASAGLVTPFSPLGTDYFVTDPLGIMELVGAGGQELAEFVSFDLEWGSGSRFFNKDHSALLIMAEPREPATNYEFAETMLGWTRREISALLSEKEFQGGSLRVTPAGSYVYAEHDHRFIEQNIRLVSWVAIIGNLILCLLVYPRIPLLLMALVPTSLGILWTTGIIAWYPGHVNLISLSFIAILAGLGDDQVVYFFNRVPQEWKKGKSLSAAIEDTYKTTGRSIVLCIMTVAIATVSLALARLKGLAEFGLVLTIGLLMLLVHTLLTVPALMRLWWRFFPPSAPEDVTFRFLPRVARAAVGLIEKRAKVILGLSLLVVAASLAVLPFLRTDRRIEIIRTEGDPALVGQRRLAAKFGIEGNPEVLLIQGGQQQVLEKAQALVEAIEPLKQRGIVKAVYSPSQILPPPNVQTTRAKGLQDIHLERTARLLKQTLQMNGLNLVPFKPAIDRLLELAADGAGPLDVEEAAALLPHGMLDSSIRKLGDNSYLAAVAVYPADPNATQIIPDQAMAGLQRRAGPFVEFSFDKINRDIQAQILQDSAIALSLTLGGILLVVYLGFRNVRITLLVLTPIFFSLVATIGVLIALRYPVSYMALVAFPLIVGIGIDNGIHLVQRFSDEADRSVGDIVMSSGAALIQSNLTTIVGFGALMVSGFKPMAEMGMVTAIGVGLALIGALFIIPSVAIVLGPRWRSGNWMPRQSRGA